MIIVLRFEYNMIENRDESIQRTSGSKFEICKKKAKKLYVF